MREGKDQEKTEPATPKRREEARKKGQVAQSREIPSVLVLMSSLGVLFFSGSWMLVSLSDFMQWIFNNIGSLHHLHGISAHSFLLEILNLIITILMPLMFAVLIAGIAANLLQVGFLFTAKPLAPKLSKLNPFEGIKRLVSLKALAELFKSIIKLLCVASIAFLMIKGELNNIPSLMQMGVGDTLSFIARVSLKICFFTCLALVILAAMDYAFQRWQHEKGLRMSKQEVKDEFKQREGDPAVKARIKGIQREMAQRRMMEAIPEADVVITNPTSLAIALKYDAEAMMAPRVIAKGAGFIADRIKKIAQENGVPLVENKLLAQTLFKVVEIGDFIPVSLYRAVAEVLAYVYGLKPVNRSYG
ncbi:MAG: flagellar biosynthesis protein FlhB [Desulfobacteraceae bacterium]|nr:MAG: flagellar biosynthesis protein FlhB [Desulfobacteraceae bacterium]